MLVLAGTLAVAAIASALVWAKVDAPLAYFVALAAYFEIVLLVLFQLVPPRLREAVARAKQRREQERRRRASERDFERRLYRALWE
jgi:hypothetical protein